MMPAPPENPAYTFETFVVSEASREAWAACVAVSEDPRGPLFLYGPTGSGKSHLLHAISHGIRRRRPDARIQRLAADTYVAWLVAAIRSADLRAFRQAPSVDVFLLDDFRPGDKPHTEKEVLHQLDALVRDGTQVVIASDARPSKVVHAWITSAHGRITELAYPDGDARVAILRHAAIRRGLTLNERVIRMLAAQGGESPRALESMINRIAAESFLTWGRLPAGR